ncbi:MAG: hypothetical protein ACYS9X_32920, partial [Planctomycetota bacterium]
MTRPGLASRRPFRIAACALALAGASCGALVEPALTYSSNPGLEQAGSAVSAFGAEIKGGLSVEGGDWPRLEASARAVGYGGDSDVDYVETDVEIDLSDFIRLPSSEGYWMRRLVEPRGIDLAGLNPRLEQGAWTGVGFPVVTDACVV